MTNKWLAEIVGTAALLFFGCGSIIVNDLHDGIIGHVGIALVFGLIVMAVIYAVGNISGAHLNPAVTIGFWVAGRMKAKEIPGYIMTQIMGGCIGVGLLKLLFIHHETLGVTLPSGPLWQSFLFEIILTFFLMVIILNVSTGHMEKGIMAGVAVGGFIALAATMGGPISGASMNPARSLAPALISGNIQHIWIYLAAPVIGACLATPFCRLIQGPSCCTSES